MAVRLFILQAHYRKPLDFTDEALGAATNGWQTLQEGLLLGYELGWPLKGTPQSNRWWNPSDDGMYNFVRIGMDTLWRNPFKDAVNDDFNFAGGLAILFEIAKDLRRERNLLMHTGSTKIPLEELIEAWQTLVELSEVLGLGMDSPPLEKSVGLSDGEIEALIEQRKVARQDKNYPESDRLRDLLQDQGIVLIDGNNGETKWHRG